MKTPKLQTRALLLIMISTLAILFNVQLRAQAKPDTTNCYPPCRKGYICVNGQCISRCNPPCSAGEECNEKGECVSINKSTTSNAPKSNVSMPCPVKISFNRDNVTLSDKYKAVLCANAKECMVEIPYRRSRIFFARAPHSITQHYKLKCRADQKYDLTMRLYHSKPELSVGIIQGLGLEEGFYVGINTSFGFRTKSNYIGLAFEYGRSEESILKFGVTDKIFIESGRCAFLPGLTLGYYRDDITVHGAVFSGLFISPSLQFRICRSSGLSFFWETGVNVYLVTIRKLYDQGQYYSNQYEERTSYVRPTLMTFGISYAFGKSIFLKSQ